MTSKELFRRILLRLNKLKIVILFFAILFGIGLYMYARTIPTIYSVKSTLFPLTAGADKSSTSRLSDLIGGGSGTKSLTEEASINIEEVAKSRQTREAVVKTRLPEFGNKTISEVLIDLYNKNRGYGTPKMKVPTVDTVLSSVGASLIRNIYTVKFNKNSLLEIVMSSTDPNLLTPVSNVLIQKITQFYKELKIKKAKFDFDFTDSKVDSLENLLNKYDKERIQMNNTTLFVSPGKLQYSVPKENMENNKQLVLAQRNGAVSNREEALWRLQRVTPIIEMLDKPEPPFDEVKPSKKIYGIGGFFIGLILFSLLFTFGIIYKFVNHQIKNTITETLSEEPVIKVISQTITTTSTV